MHLIKWIRSLVQRRKLDAELEEELRAHVEMRAEANVKAGMDPEEARFAALRRFGWVETIKETCRDQRGVGWIEQFAQDARYGTRMLRKNPGFSALAILSLGLGIAANTTIFSFVNALLFRPPPVESPAELWQVWRERLTGGPALERYQGLSYPGYAFLRDHTQSFAALAAFDPESPFVSWNHNGLGQTIQCQFVSGDFFEACRVRMGAGRAFGAQEDRAPGAAPVAVISHAFWQQSLGADPRIVGQTLDVNGVALTVVGVAPAGFTGVLAGLAPDLWSPFMMASTVLHDPEWHTRTGAFSLFGVGRLKPGTTSAQAQAELSGLVRQLELLDPGHNRDFGAAVFPSMMVPSPFRGFVRAFTAVLMAAVSMVLLIACANAANLMLARAMTRRQEMAVRASVGASRGRLSRQLLTESLLLSLAGGVVGLVLTSWFVPVLLRLTPPTLPIRPEIHLDVRVFGFTLLVSLLTGIVFGSAPAWKCGRVDLVSALKDGSRSAGSKRSRFVGALIAGQVAFCLVLLIAGTLCLRSLLNAQRVELGFRLEDRITAEMNLKDYGYSAEQTERFNQQLMERLSASPSVQSAAYADYLPLDTRLLALGYSLDGRQPPPGQESFVLQTFDVGPGYFAAMGTHVLRGREFVERDREGAPAVAIVNQALADELFPGQEPIGRSLFEGKPGQGTAYEIVGVVESGKYRSLGEAPRPVVFRSRLQHGGPRSTLVVHARGGAAAALVAIRGAVRDLDPRLSLARLGTLDQHLALALFPARTTGLLLGVFGLVALLLAISGLFGVISYSVSQRTREIGIRMAIGAQRSEVVRMVVRQGMRLAAVGLLLGFGGALAVTRFLRGFLYGVSPIDPVTFVLVPLMLALVALLACLIPARRASRVEPTVALRCE